MRALALLAAGCVNLDGFVYNPVHCSTVGPETCTGNAWDRVCVPCDEPYDWTREYPYDEVALAGGVSLRPVPEGVAARETLPTEDGEGELDAVWLPSHGGDPALATTTILYHHGNYAGIEHYQPRVRVLWELGYNVYVWDYRGYGKSEPDVPPTAAQLLADARQVRAHVASLAPDPARVVPYGYSLGAVPAIEAALAEPPCALLLEAPFTSTSAIAGANARVGLPETFLSEGRFDNIRKIRSYDGQLLVMVGSEDTFFPAAEVTRLAESAGGDTELWVLDGVRHGISDGGVVEAGIAAYRDRVRAFLDGTACLAP